MIEHKTESRDETILAFRMDSNPGLLLGVDWRRVVLK